MNQLAIGCAILGTSCLEEISTLFQVNTRIRDLLGTLDATGMGPVIDEWKMLNLALPLLVVCLAGVCLRLSIKTIIITGDKKKKKINKTNVQNNSIHNGKIRIFFFCAGSP